MEVIRVQHRIDGEVVFGLIVLRPFLTIGGEKRIFVWGGDRFCMVVMWGKKGAEAMNDGGCEAR